jgi:hypothetical protein
MRSRIQQKERREGRKEEKKKERRKERKMKERKGSEIGRKATILVKNTGRLVDLE